MSRPSSPKHMCLLKTTCPVRIRWSWYRPNSLRVRNGKAIDAVWSRIFDGPDLQNFLSGLTLLRLAAKSRRFYTLTPDLTCQRSAGSFVCSIDDQVLQQKYFSSHDLYIGSRDMEQRLTGRCGRRDTTRNGTEKHGHIRLHYPWRRIKHEYMSHIKGVFSRLPFIQDVL